MDRAFEAACRRDLSRAGLASHGALVPLLALLRAAPESHVSLGQVSRMAEQSKLPLSSAELAGQLYALADCGLLRRLPMATNEPMFDTELEPHSHLVYENTGQTVDLHVSPETLLAIIRQTLVNYSDKVEILVRIRGS